MSKLYCKPLECSFKSSRRAVCKRLADLINACEHINRWTIEGRVVADVELFSFALRKALRDDGYVVESTPDKWVVRYGH